MLIDKHTVKIVGSKWDHKKDKHQFQKVLSQFLLKKYQQGYFN